MPFDEFISAENPMIYMQLSNVLCMHASLEMQCEPHQLEGLYADKVGYNIGGKLFTSSQLLQML